MQQHHEGKIDIWAYMDRVYTRGEKISALSDIYVQRFDIGRPVE
jgi:hypothetical protein